MTTQIMAGLAVPALIETLKKGLEKINHPAAKGAADAISTLQNAVISGGVTPENLGAVNAHIEHMTTIAATRDAAIIAQTNESLRAEIASTDAYVRRMRPTFGYMMAATWGAQMFALAYLIVTDPTRVSVVLNAVESLSTLWVVALSVMGIYVYQRSAEKIAGISEKNIQVSQKEKPRENPRAVEKGYND